MKEIIKELLVVGFLAAMPFGPVIQQYWRKYKRMRRCKKEYEEYKKRKEKEKVQE